VDFLFLKFLLGIKRNEQGEKNFVKKLSMLDLSTQTNRFLLCTLDS